jgi:amidase
VDARVREAASDFTKLGVDVREISVPWHLHGPAIWAPIALEWAFHTLFRSASVGRHTEGLYSVSQAARLASLRDRANELPDTVKVGMLLAGYTDQMYQGYFYFKAMNLRRRLRAAYDAVLAEHDLILMPTTRVMASKIPPMDAALEVIMQHSWEQIGNTCPFNVTGHPAISIPCGLGEGDRPVGLMLIGKHWQESTLYRAAHAFEQAVDWQSRKTKKTGGRKGK